MVPVFFVVGAAILMKGTAVVWVGSIATSPLCEEKRRNLLNHTESVLAKLGEINHSPSPRKLDSLKADIALLRPSVRSGWVQPTEFAAASRIATYITWLHTKSSLSGITALTRNTVREIYTSSVEKVFAP